MGNSDSKAQFRGLVQTLAEGDIPADSELWEQFWELPTCDKDVFLMMQPEDVRGLLKVSPESLRTLLHKAAGELASAAAHEQLPVAGKRRVLNAVRVLTRCLPFVLEQSEEAFVEDTFWDPATYSAADSCLAHALLRSVGDLLFTPGLSLAPHVRKPAAPASPVEEDVDAGVPAARANLGGAWGEDEDTEADEDAAGTLGQLVNPALLWRGGLGTVGRTDSRKPSPDTSLNENRYELLRLLLVLQSQILFCAPAECKPEENRWIAAATLGTPRNALLVHAPELLCSLINEVCSFDPVGWGVPYGSKLRSGEKEVAYMDICMHALLTLLEVNTQENLFRRLMSSIDTVPELAYLAESITRLIENAPQASNTYLPGSATSLESYQELLVLLWKLLDSNKAFMSIVLQRCDVNRLVRPICFYIWTNRQSASKVGFVHICTFVLLLFSGERSFGVSLNDPFNPSDLYLKGAPKMASPNHADLLVLVLAKTIFDGSKRLTSLYNCFLTILSNISPYIRSFGQVASMRLLALFDCFSSRRFLLSHENNYHYLYFLLDIFNNAIQYQYEGNANLVYALCLHAKTFDSLDRLELDPPASAAPPAPPAEEHEPSAEGEVVTVEPFRPTREWFESWKPKLPLNAIQRLLEILVPRIEEMCAQPGSMPRESEILGFLKNTTMVGLLPVPHPIVIRRYQPNRYTTMWFTTYTWGVIFLRSRADMPLWDSKSIRLFTINIVNVPG